MCNPHQVQIQNIMYLLKNLADLNCVKDQNLISDSSSVLCDLNLVLESTQDRIKSNVMPWLSPGGLADGMILKSIGIIQSYIQGHKV